MKQLYLAFFLFTLLCAGCEKQQKAIVHSPDGRLTLEARLENGRLYYAVDNTSGAVVGKSLLGFVLKDGDFNRDFRIEHINHSSFSEVWQQPWGEELSAENTYNQMEVMLSEKGGAKRQLAVIFRVFDNGIGFRYHFPTQENLKEFVIMDELTEFNLPQGGQAWSIPSWHTDYYEGLYRQTGVNQLDTVCTPLTVEVNENLYLSIHEANLTDYAAMNLTPLTAGSTTLKAELTPWSTGEKVFVKAPFSTPWRTVIVADKPGDLLLSRLMLNLNEPNRIADLSWIQPGRYIGIWWGMHMEKYTWGQGPKHGATTANTKRYLDFAARHGFAGVLVEGWNRGWDGQWSQHGDQFSFTESYPDFDLEELSKYATIRNTRLIGHHETGGATKNYEDQLEDAFSLYQRYGVNAVKTGYVNPLLDKKERHSSQYGVRHYRKVIETAAKYRIMIDNHEPVMPTGLQRTYPNLMTQEGVRGQEYNAWSTDGGNPPEHTCIIPFTRGLAGPMDFTPGIFNFDNPVFPDTRPRTTIAKQLALSVVLFSPLQMAADRIENYEDQPAFEFITSCPTSWAKTVVPEATIGNHLTIARKDRASENWFIGSITNAEARTMHLPLSFLEEGISYKAKIFKDGADAHYQSNPYPVEIEEQEVNAGTVLTIKQAAGGGTAIILSPVSSADRR